MIAADRRTQSPNRLVWSEGWRPPGAQSAFIKWTGWTLAMTMSWWQHHKHCHSYYYYYYYYCGVQWMPCLVTLLFLCLSVWSHSWCVPKQPFVSNYFYNGGHSRPTLHCVSGEFCTLTFKQLSKTMTNPASSRWLRPSYECPPPRTTHRRQHNERPSLRTPGLARLVWTAVNTSLIVTWIQHQERSHQHRLHHLQWEIVHLLQSIITACNDFTNALVVTATVLFHLNMCIHDGN